MKENNDKENELFDGIEDYDLPKEKSVLIDTEKQEIVENLTPIRMLMAVAKQENMEMKEIVFDEKQNYDTGCRKRDCWGRGYLGIRDGYPIPCSCIFLKKPEEVNLPPNREKVRMYIKTLRREYVYSRDYLGKKLGLKQIDKNLWVSKTGIKFLPLYNKEKKKWIFTKRV